jgi:hypothetical protein
MGYNGYLYVNNVTARNRQTGFNGNIAQASYDGIMHVVISNNDFSGNQVGIYVATGGGLYARNITLINNNVNGSTTRGIGDLSVNSTIINNTYYGCVNGLQIGFNTTIENEDFSKFNITGIVISTAYSDFNTIRNVDVSWTGAGKSGTGIELGGLNDYTTITNVTAKNRQTGLNAYASGGILSAKNINISNNDFSNCNNGITTQSSNDRPLNITIVNNNVSNAVSW